MSELTQHELEILVEGKPQVARSVFYDKAIMNVQKSRAAGRRVYDTVCFLKETQAGVTDWVAVKARENHIKLYPEEYQHYLASRRGAISPSIEIIPNITPAEMQELIDYGLSTIRVLSEAEQVPPHLTHIHQNAKVLQAVFKEQSHGIEEESIEEEVHEESPEGLLSQANRRINARDVERHEVPESSGLRERSPAERVQTSGRIQHHSSVMDGNWSMTGFTQ